MLKFSVVNQSKRIGAADLSTIIGAVSFQLKNHIAPTWNLAAPDLSFASNLASVPSEAVVVLLMDRPDIPNAGGYHDLDAHGNPIGKVFVNPYLDNGGTVMTGANSVSVAFSHELAEALVNPLIYGWADNEASGLIALEIGDPVENDFYTIGYGGRNVAVSNFVLPSWFSVEGHAPFDHMNKLRAPRTMTRGGYTIVARISSETQRFARDVAFTTQEEAAEYPAWKTALKLTEGSRTLNYISKRG